MDHIPGTLSDSAKRLRWHRLPDISADLGDGTIQTARVYEADTLDGTLKALVSQDLTEKHGKLWHLSVSHRGHNNQPDRVPVWDEIKHAKYSLLPQGVDVPMVLIFPRRSAPYVNVHNTTLHLWQSTDPEIDIT